jgi:hypothetical protein
VVTDKNVIFVRTWFLIGLSLVYLFINNDEGFSLFWFLPSVISIALFVILSFLQLFNKKSTDLLTLNDQGHRNRNKWNRILKQCNFSTNSANFGNENPNDENEKKKKKSSSWRQFFFLRLTVTFGLLLFLVTSYLLSESFNISKVFNQIIIFFNDDNAWNNVWRIIRRCWLTYINIWSLRQWSFSVGAILPLYWYLFDILFHIGLIDRKFTAKEKFFFISTDLLLNFIVGLTYMAHPQTVIGALMRECPVALSPYFIVVEIIAYVSYQAWLKYKLKNKK